MVKNSAILVIEDDPSICDVLNHNLSVEGFAVECVSDGPQGLEKALTGEHSLIILDLNLPRLSGISICKELRTKYPALPLIMLTSRDSELDRVMGLEAGADDYVIKPFSVYELMARIRARMRISAVSESGRHAMVAEVAPTTLTCGPLKLRLEKRSAELEGANLELTRMEFDVLAHLMQNRGRVISRAELLKIVWGTEIDSYEDAVTTLVGRLRRKMERMSPGNYFLKVTRGVGYRISELDELTKSPGDEN